MRRKIDSVLIAGACIAIAAGAAAAPALADVAVTEPHVYAAAPPAVYAPAPTITYSAPHYIESTTTTTYTYVPAPRTDVYVQEAPGAVVDTPKWDYSTHVRRVSAQVHTRTVAHKARELFEATPAG